MQALIMMREKAGSLEFLVRAPANMKLESLGQALVRDYIKSMQKRFKHPGGGESFIPSNYSVSDLKPVYPQEISGQERYERLINETDELLEKNDHLVRSIQRAYLDELERKGDLLPSTQAYLNRAAGVTFKKAKPRDDGKTFYSELEGQVADKLLYKFTRKVKNGLFRRKKKIVTEEVIDILTKENDLPIEDEYDEMFVNNTIDTFAPMYAFDGGGGAGDTLAVFNDKEKKKHKLFPYLATALFILGTATLAGCTSDNDDDNGDDDGNNIIEGKRTGTAAYWGGEEEGPHDDVSELEVREPGADHLVYLWFIGYNASKLREEINKEDAYIKVEVVKLDPTEYIEKLGPLDGDDEKMYSYEVVEIIEPDLESTRGGD